MIEKCCNLEREWLKHLVILHLALTLHLDCMVLITHHNHIKSNKPFRDFSRQQNTTLEGKIQRDRWMGLSYFSYQKLYKFKNNFFVFFRKSKTSKYGGKGLIKTEGKAATEPIVVGSARGARASSRALSGRVSKSMSSSSGPRASLGDAFPRTGVENENEGKANPRQSRVICDSRSFRAVCLAPQWNTPNSRSRALLGSVTKDA